VLGAFRNSTDHKPILSSVYKFGEFQTNMNCIQEMLKVEIKQETVDIEHHFQPALTSSEEAQLTG
jgi:hypothetical protein